MTSPPSILTELLPGQYMVCSIEGDTSNSLYAVTVDGKRHVGLPRGGADQNAYLSPDGKWMAYSVLNSIEVANLENNATIPVPDKLGCFDSIVNLAWSPDGAALAVPCGSSIFLIRIRDGEMIGYIPSMIESKPPNLVEAAQPVWSPNGKWLAYYLWTDDPQNRVSGPFVTDTSCFADGSTCDKKTREVANLRGTLAWTPDNHLGPIYKPPPCA